jgi:hypothetical protein
MTRVGRDKYSVLIRGDYLYALGKLASTRQARDEIIKKAVESFIDDYPFEEKNKWIKEERPRVRVTFSADVHPPYHMYLEFVELPDGLVKRLERACRHPEFDRPFYDSLGTVLNVVIRLYLQKEQSELLKKDAESGNEPVSMDHV